MSQRYKVVPGSESAHCCFEFTIVDTMRPLMIDGDPFENQFDTVCETFSEVDAELVCNALNAAK